MRVLSGSGKRLSEAGVSHECIKKAYKRRSYFVAGRQKHVEVFAPPEFEA